MSRRCSATVVCGDDIVDDVVVVAVTTTTAVRVPPPAPDERQRPAGLGGTGLGLTDINVVPACIVLILFSSQLKRGPRPSARAAVWSDESSLFDDFGARPVLYCQLRGRRFHFAFSTEQHSHRTRDNLRLYRQYA